MSEQKPYLNPQLRIVDLTEELHTNRTYLSGFINRTYGLNSSGFINRLRMREFNALSKNPDFGQASKDELASQAGFENYRSYLRVKKDVV